MIETRPELKNISDYVPGKSIEETYPIVMGQAKVTIVGEMVSLNRMEKALADCNKSALDTITEKYGFPAKAIVTMKEVQEALEGTVLTPELMKEIDAYYAEWGAKE